MPGIQEDGMRIPRFARAALWPGLLAGALATATAGETITVYKTATCGCCKQWIAHLQNNGFKVEARDVANLTPIKRRYGVSPELESCHTAVVQGYVIEGHVPAKDIQRLLQERPKISGLAVPDMPVGSPGMEGPNPEPYDVLTFDQAGRTSVYARYK
jgi:hypothetical protein